MVFQGIGRECKALGFHGSRSPWLYTRVSCKFAVFDYALLCLPKDAELGSMFDVLGFGATGAWDLQAWGGV